MPESVCLPTSMFPSGCTQVVTYSDINGVCCANPCNMVDAAGKKCEPNTPNTCDTICTEQIELVCGSDGTTYSNPCKLGVADCISRANGGDGVRKVNDGECPLPTNPPEVPSCDATTVSTTCPVVRCEAPPAGCSLVERFKVNSDGECCPVSCNFEDQDGKVCIVGDNDGKDEDEGPLLVSWAFPLQPSFLALSAAFLLANY